MSYSFVSGFTLIEVIVVIGLVSIITGLSLFATMDGYRAYAFRSETNTVIAALQKARNQSLANIAGEPHGVAMQSNQYAIFEGANFVGRNAVLDETIPSQFAVITSGLSEVVFGQLSGSAASGDILLSDGARSSTISINYEGRISW